MISRRSFLSVLSGAIAAPMVAKAELLMPLRGIRFIKIPDWCPEGWLPCEGQLINRVQFPDLHAIMKKMRLFGAENSDDFTLPGLSPLTWIGPHVGTPNYTHRLNQAAPVERKIINAIAVKRPNGSIVNPGSIFTYTLPQHPVAVTGALQG